MELATSTDVAGSSGLTYVCNYLYNIQVLLLIFVIVLIAFLCHLMFRKMFKNLRK